MNLVEWDGVSRIDEFVRIVAGRNMKIVENASKVMCLIEMAHELLQTLPNVEDRQIATSHLEIAHSLVQHKIQPLVDDQ